MGYALATAAMGLGAEVILVSGPVSLEPPGGARMVYAGSALQMRTAVKKHSGRADILVFAAAVCDYRPRRFSREKIKSVKNTMTVSLVKNPDIIREAGLKKGKRIVVGFALETGGLVKNAKKKMKEKNADLMVANPAGNLEAGSGSAVIISRNGEITRAGKRSKQALSRLIMRKVAGLTG